MVFEKIASLQAQNISAKTFVWLSASRERFFLKQSLMLRLVCLNAAEMLLTLAH